MQYRHGRACPGHPRLAYLPRRKGVDARHKAGHDGVERKPRGQDMSGFVYIMTNRPNGTLYIGVTADLARRAWEHREARVPGFTKRYGLKQLVWYEQFADIRDAIQREKTMKHWSRTWKVRTIMDMNPAWRDLYSDLI
jgi:putative endonuclease